MVPFATATGSESVADSPQSIAAMIINRVRAWTSNW